MKRDKYGWFSCATHHRCCDSKSNICIQSLNLSVAPPVTPAGSPPQTAMLCRLKSLLSHSGECLWLSLVESSQGWREAGRGWCRCGRRDKAVEGGEGWASGTAGICIPLSSVTGREWWGGTGTKRSVGFGRTVARVQESKVQHYKILPSLLTAWPLWAGIEIPK